MRSFKMWHNDSVLWNHLLFFGGAVVGQILQWIGVSDGLSKHSLGGFVAGGTLAAVVDLGINLYKKFLAERVNEWIEKLVPKKN